MPRESGLHVEGLDELRRTLRRIDRELPKGVRVALKRAASPVVDDAKHRAPRSPRPLGPRGRRRHMADTIRATVRGNTAYIATSARDPATGYRYPRQIEFGAGGRRAFLRPALEAKRGEVGRRMGRLLDDISDTWEGR